MDAVPCREPNRLGRCAPSAERLAIQRCNGLVDSAYMPGSQMRVEYSTVMVGWSNREQSIEAAPNPADACRVESVTTTWSQKQSHSVDRMIPPDDSMQVW
jgi:hypothetical protein